MQGRTIGWLLLMLPALLAVEARGDDFRIQSKVFSDGVAPLAENLTLFSGGVVYDYLEQPATVTVFDAARGRFILLDPAHRRQAEVTADEVQQFVSMLKERCAKDREEFLQFMANPQFTTEDAAGELVLLSPWVKYRVSSASARTPEEADEYRQFADWYAKLNTLLNPGNIPPFARLELNSILFKRNEIPERVRLELTGPKLVGQQQVTFRSEHLITRRLLNADLKRIQQTGDQLSTFEKVGLTEFGK